MDHYPGIDVSLELSSLCVVDATGQVVREAKVASEPEALAAWLSGVGVELTQIGLEAGPLSQWLHAGLRMAGLPVELLETRHVRSAFKIMPVMRKAKEALARKLAVVLHRMLTDGTPFRGGSVSRYSVSVPISGSPAG